MTRLQAQSTPAQMTEEMAVVAPASAPAVDAQPVPAAVSRTDERVRQLEAEVEQLHGEARQQQDTVRLLRGRLAAAESGGRWAPALGMALGALLLIVAWLALRLRKLGDERQRERDDARMQRLIDAAASSEIRPTEAAAAAPRRIPQPDEPLERRSTIAPRGPAAAREVSVEEMLDLEQQTDFFIALGQQDAAINLLLGHIQDSGNGGAMPYLKLLEIYRGQGDAENYERLRSRFEQRYNAAVPAFGDDAQAGRDLERYPQVLSRIEALWSDPDSAIGEIDALMTRRDHNEPFDLPAYRELAVLAAVARDLRALPAAAAGAVDLWLPLDEEPVDHSDSVRRELAERITTTQPLTRELMDQLLASPEGAPGLDLDLSEQSPPREFTRAALFADLGLRELARRSDSGALEPPARSPGR